MSLLHALTPGLSANQWDLLLWTGLFTVAIGIATSLRFPHRRVGLGVGLLGALLVTASATLLEAASSARSQAVVAEACALHISPATTSPVLSELEPGEPVLIDGSTYGEFTAVRVRGQRGWIPSQDVVPLVQHDG